MKTYCKTHWRLWVRMTIVVALTFGIVQITVLAQQCSGIRDEVVRLHILANSNSEQDQALKLKVRDRLLADGGDYLKLANNSEQALVLLEQNLPNLERLAEDTLRQNGCDDTVTCSLEQTYFNTRIYDNVTMPAGMYTALRVIIGDGSGKNWWCVMFPPLCIPAAGNLDTKEETLEQNLTKGQADLVENGAKYEVKFKAVEWFQSAVAKFKDWF